MTNPYSSAWIESNFANFVITDFIVDKLITFPSKKKSVFFSSCWLWLSQSYLIELDILFIFYILHKFLSYVFLCLPHSSCIFVFDIYLYFMNIYDTWINIHQFFSSLLLYWYLSFDGVISIHWLSNWGWFSINICFFMYM